MSVVFLVSTSATFDLALAGHGTLGAAELVQRAGAHLVGPSSELGLDPAVVGGVRLDLKGVGEDQRVASIGRLRHRRWPDSVVDNPSAQMSFIDPPGYIRVALQGHQQ